jgi:hypothetical protein
MALKVLEPGFGTTIQDLGRIGYGSMGIPESGAMDLFALQAANLLVGNEQTGNVLFRGPVRSGCLRLMEAVFPAGWRCLPGRGT